MTTVGGIFLRMLRGLLTSGISAFALYNSGFGYANGDAVVQQTNKGTAVTLNAWCGQITTNNAQLNATASIAFTLTNNRIVTGDYEVHVWLKSGNTANSYFVSVDAVAAGSCSISIRNYTAGNLSEALVIGFAVRPAAIA